MAQAVVQQRIAQTDSAFLFKLCFDVGRAHEQLLFERLDAELRLSVIVVLLNVLNHLPIHASLLVGVFLCWVMRQFPFVGILHGIEEEFIVFHPLTIAVAKNEDDTDEGKDEQNEENHDDFVAQQKSFSGFERVFQFVRIEYRVDFHRYGIVFGFTDAIHQGGIPFKSGIKFVFHAQFLVSHHQVLGGVQ